MATIHIFNPEHDISLSTNNANTTPPHAARQLRASLSWIPAIWANNGDIVVVEDANFAQKTVRKSGIKIANVIFLEKNDLKELLKNFSNSNDINVDAWGWDKAVCGELMKMGVNKNSLPNSIELERLRDLSGRKTSIDFLHKVREKISRCEGGKYCNLIVGERFVAATREETEKLVNQLGKTVLKAPWSCSGRGVKYVENNLTPSQKGWISNTLKEQSHIIVEPYYNKILDFGMEFEITKDHKVNYKGLSVFLTQNGTYAGNLVDQEHNKEEIIKQYINEPLLSAARQSVEKILSKSLSDKYCGMLGIDMMIVADPDNHTFKLHPCIEINFRRTMGHVALALTPKIGTPRKLMSITHKVNDVLTLSPIDNNFVITV